MIIELISLIRKVQNLLYSMIIKACFGKVGTKFRIEYPIRVMGGKNISVGHNFYCLGRLRIEAYSKHNNVNFSPIVEIGNNVSFNSDCHVGCINKIIIGNDVLIASKVFITDHFHGKIDSGAIDLPPNRRSLFSPGHVIIHDNVWIGENVSIMPNVTIGKNCIVGANSVVTKSFPSNSVIAGVPARLIKKLD